MENPAEEDNPVGSNNPVATEEGIINFLAGSFTKGVGKVYAKRIVERFGQEIIEDGFNFDISLKEIKGLPAKNIKDLTESLNSLKVSPRLLALLYSTGLKDVEVEKIISHYGKRAEKVVNVDPYDMVENVWKFSFFSADKIGKFMGIPQTDPRRLKGALLTAVKFYAEDGNMFASESQALQTASRIAGVTEEVL